ncbi:DUF3068 domain-containing protein, partial [Streptomyces sp. SID3343]|uniref:DUF3068 domain-containing protein n=1 Tax=Streptomyces sp. SID3343 TaxID=2690260 RepID=UPI0013688973
MRRKSALILLVAAVFCVALAPLLREFVFPRLVAKSLAGEDAYQVVVLEANNATLLGAPEEPGKARVTAVQTIRPNADDSKDGTVVWDLNLVVLDGAGKVVTQLPERYAFDAATQVPKNCCGEQIDGAPAAHTGLAYKFPFFVGKRDYNYYDSRAHAANVISYRGTDERDGLRTYRFEQQVPWTKIPMPKKLPGDLDPVVLEKEGKQLWYTVTRKMWVEPVTGTPVYVEETHKEELRDSPPAGQADAQPAVYPVFEGTFTLKPAWSSALIADAKDQSAKLRLLHDTAPLGLLVLGAVLFVAALVLQFMQNHGLRLKREARGKGAAASAEQTAPRSPEAVAPAAVAPEVTPKPVPGAGDVTEVLPSVPDRPEAEPDADTEPEVAPEIGPEPEPEPEPAAEIGSQPEGEPAAEVVPESGSNVASEPVPEPEPDAEIGSQSEGEPAAEVVPESGSNVASEPVPEPEPDAEIGSQSEGEPAAEVVPESGSNVASEPVPEPE